MSLEKEIETYDRLLPALMRYEGRFVVVHGDKVVGVFPDRDTALEAGYRASTVAFLCRQILAEQPVRFLPTMWRVRQGAGNP